MTAPQEPLKLTMFLLTRTTWTDSTVIGLYFDKTKARTEADRLEAAKGQGDGWQEYYVNPIGVADAPARDDAAELRAALVKMADLVFTISSADEELSFPHYEDSERTQAYLAAHRRAKKAAWESLQELAAEYDGVPALAATEGQP